MLFLILKQLECHFTLYRKIHNLALTKMDKDVPLNLESFTAKATIPVVDDKAKKQSTKKPVKSEVAQEEQQQLTTEQLNELYSQQITTITELLLIDLYKVCWYYSFGEHCQSIKPLLQALRSASSASNITSLLEEARFEFDYLITLDGLTSESDEENAKKKVEEILKSANKVLHVCVHTPRFIQYIGDGKH